MPIKFITVMGTMGFCDLYYFISAYPEGKQTRADNRTFSDYARISEGRLQVSTSIVPIGNILSHSEGIAQSFDSDYVQVQLVILADVNGCLRSVI